MLNIFPTQQLPMLKILLQYPRNPDIAPSKFITIVWAYWWCLKIDNNSLSNQRLTRTETWKLDFEENMHTNSKRLMYIQASKNQPIWQNPQNIQKASACISINRQDPESYQTQLSLSSSNLTTIIWATWWCLKTQCDISLTRDWPKQKPESWPKDKINAIFKQSILRPPKIQNAANIETRVNLVLP